MFVLLGWHSFAAGIVGWQECYIFLQNTVIRMTSCSWGDYKEDCASKLKHAHMPLAAICSRLLMVFEHTDFPVYPFINICTLLC